MMFGIQYLKAGPTQVVIHFQNGSVRRAGAGLSFLYYRPTASIAIVPIGSAEAPFIFNEMTADFQEVSVQGQMLYRIKEPEKVAALLDYTVDGSPDRYLSDDPDQLSQRLINLAQVLTRAEIARLPLRQALSASDAIAEAVTSGLMSNPTVGTIGVEVLSFSILAIKPTPEMARALEAEARESLLQEADEAIYDRRNAAVEQERRIQENELETQIAVQVKERQIREAAVEADLAVEAKRQLVREAELSGQILLESERRALVEARSENVRAAADADSYALDASLRPLRSLDSGILQMLAVQSVEPRLMVSLALKEIAANAGKIGHLNISPDLLQSLIQNEQ